MKITIKTLSGETFTLEVEADNTVKSLIRI